LPRPNRMGGNMKQQRIHAAGGRIPGMVAAAAFLCFAAGAEAQSTDVLKGSGSVVVSTWGGSYTDAQVEAFFAPFTEATGIEVITTGTPSAAKLKVMHESGNVEWDIVDAEAQMMYAAIEDGALAPIDY